VGIWYVRMPDRGSYLLLPTADAAPPHKHLTPAELRPAAGTPHWKKPLGGALQFSWPAVYLRTGAAAAPTPQLTASFATIPSVSVSAKIKAEGPNGLVVAEKTVSFAGGVASNITFDLQNLPATAKRLDGLELTWKYQVGTDPEKVAGTTKHTLFIVDELPKKANNLYVDQYLWEILEWSSQWTDGQTGKAAIFAAVWAHFYPVKAVHDTGLVYWKNYRTIHPAQDLASAIQSQDDPNIQQRNSASCIVFDRVLLNCLSVHGFSCAEIMIDPDPARFTRGAVNYIPGRWHDTTIIGQGNTDSPPFWGNHWIADIEMPGALWKIYDPSYGAGPATSNAPSGLTVDVLDFEPMTVDYFEGLTLPSGVPVVQISRNPSAAIPPHLIGHVEWKT
jgi:hypothetical protein